MAQSGNTVALKSFQSYMVNEGLLSKAVEAIKAGEKEARSTGNIQSFEIFYKGFRQNIAIGRIYIVPPSVADKKGQNFPTALLYGCLVRTYGGEEISDLISHKIGDSEWDEYSQADYASIKEKLFGSADGKFASLIIYAPNWVNKREYTGFQFPKDDNQLSNLTRHVIFSSYFDPRLSSAFDALMSDVETSKLDVLDITPKMNFPALAENPLREFPLLTKEGSAKKPRLALTFKTADEVTKEVLEPQEMDVFDSLDQALRNSLLPSTETVDEAGERHEKGFKAPAKDAEVPRLASVECDNCEGAGCKFCNNKGTKKAANDKLHASIETYIGAAGGPDVLTEITRRLDAIFQKEKAANPKGFMDAFESRLDTHMLEIAKGLDLTMDYDAAGNTYKFYDQIGKAYRGNAKVDWENNAVPSTASSKKADATAVHETKFTNVGPGTMAEEAANQRTEGYVKEKDVPKVVINSAPIGIALDETGVPRRPEEERKDKQAKRVDFTPKMDIQRMGTVKGLDLSASISAGFDKARTTGDKADIHTAEVKEYYASMNHDNQAHHAVADHAKEIKAGKFGDNPLSMSASDKGSVENNITKNIGQARQSQDAVKDHHAAIDAAKWGGIGKKQASALFVGSAKKVAEGLDQFTRGYIETALWSSNDESDPSGGQPLDANYDIRDLAPSCLQAMTEDCTRFQNDNRDLLDAAWSEDGQDAFRQGHDFWLTRCGHGAGYWDGDYPTTGDGLTEASKAFGNVDIYVGDDDLIYQFGAENAGDRDHGQKGPVTASKKKTAAKPKVSDASYVSSLIAGGPRVDSYDARSQRSKSAAEKREEEMARKYGSQRKKFAEVPQDIEDIWAETMETIGPAPEIKLPGETEENAQSTEGDHEINAPEAGADTWSDVPEQVKGDQEAATVEVEEALENDTTKSEEPKPSTGDGGASADSEETSSEGESEEKSEEKSEGGSKSEWAKNRGKSEKKDDEPKEEEESEEKSEPKEASTKKKAIRVPVKCNQCQMMSINGTAVHESGCPNDGARWDAENQDWVKQRKCFECGFDVDADDPCCNAEVEFEEEPAHFAGLDSILADAAVLDEVEDAPQVDAPAVFYECGSCGGVHPSLVTSEKLGLGWDGDCRDEHGHFEESDLPYSDNATFITLDEQMAPDFDEAILASSGKTAGPNDGEDEEVFEEEPENFFGFDEASPDPCNHQPHDVDTTQSVCEVCGQEIYYDPEHDYWTILNGLVEASAKQADTADNPANENGGEGAIEVKTDKGIDKTASVIEIKNAGKVTTPKYVLRIVVPGHHVSDASWDVNSRGQLRGAGKPSDANLVKYMDALNASMAPGGANAHLGDKWKPTEAAIYHNDGTYKNPLATWTAAEEPLFKVEGAAPNTEERINELKALIRSELISEENGAEPQLDENGKTKEDIATCGNCGMSWNDALITNRTPAPSARCPYEYIHPEIAELKKLLRQRKKSADISGDVAEAKSEVVSPDTVDKDIQQPTVSVDDAGEKHAADISGDIAEAKSEVEYNKGEVADEPKATDTVNPDHFAAAEKVRLKCNECGKKFSVSSAASDPECPKCHGVDWDIADDHVASDERDDDVPVSQGESASEGQPKSDLNNGAPEAHDVPPQVDDKTACAGYGDEEDEERPIDLGIGDLADLVVEKEDAN